MRIGRREAKRSLTGLTLPTVLGTGGGGATWTVEPGDKALASIVLQYLEDRRVLYEPFEAEDPPACIASVNEMRRDLTGFIRKTQSPELRNPLRAIRAACRQFLTDAYIESRPGRIQRIDVWSGTQSWLFNQALGSLRARVGTSVAIIIETFDVDTDEYLAKIMPPPVD
jgi:hypothetical protein